MHEEPALQGGVPQGTLERALVDLSINSAKRFRDREAALKSTRAGEYDQQVEVAFSGIATSSWGGAVIPVTWEHPFVYSPLQRDPQFLTPHVSSHIEFTQNSGQLVIATAHVVGWLQNDSQWFIGANLQVAVCAPNADSTVPYAGIVHATFEGYAFPTDEEDQS